MKEIIGVIAAVLGLISYAPYLRDIVKGKSKPHPYSWFVWSLTNVIILALQVTHGAGPGAYTTATVSVIGFVVCILGFKNGIKDITPLDTVFLVSALVATGIWIFAKQPTLSMALLIVIDMFGMGPTVRKSWHKPHEETLFMWSVNGFRHALSIAALQTYSVLTLLNPVAWTIANFSFSLLLISRRRILLKVHN
jgi:hypothetical protein